MKKFIKNINPNIIFIIILIIQMMFMIKICDMKKGYWVDELWSYGLANSNYHAQLWDDGGLSNIKIDPTVFKNYILVNQNERFNYSSVIYNQTKDVHPPLFYLVLHTMSSFFPEQFSKWFGLIPNIIYFAITIIFIYKMGKLFAKNDPLFPLLPVLFFGFSLAAINSVTFIRMYMLFAMLATIFAYLHMKCLKDVTINRKNFLAIALIMFLGSFTHYYFIIFAIPYALYFLILFIKRKKYKDIIKYFGALAIGCFTTFILFPSVLVNGQEHRKTFIENLLNVSDLGSRIKSFFTIVNGDLFGNLFFPIIIIGALIIILHFITKIIGSLSVHDNQFVVSINQNADRFIFDYHKIQYIFMIMIGNIVYFIATSKLVPLVFDRYMMPIYPLLLFTICVFIYEVIKLACQKKGKTFFVTALFLALIISVSYFTGSTRYLYKNQIDKVAISKKYQNKIAVFVYDEDDDHEYILNNNILELMNYREVYQLPFDKLKNLFNVYHGNEEEVIIYIDKYMNQMPDQVELCKNELKLIFFLTKDELLFEDDKVYAYRIYN